MATGAGHWDRRVALGGIAQPGLQHWREGKIGREAEGITNDIGPDHLPDLGVAGLDAIQCGGEPANLGVVRLQPGHRTLEFRDATGGANDGQIEHGEQDDRRGQGAAYETAETQQPEGRRQVCDWVAPSRCTTMVTEGRPRLIPRRVRRE